jgi:SagB-type dehydrogenase family enzyme
VVSLSFGREDSVRNKALDRWCAQNGIVWLRAEIDESRGYADFGPLFNVPESPCYSCFREIHSRRAATSPGKPSRNVDLALGLLATEITYLLSGIGPVILGKGLRRFELPDWEAHDLQFFRVPGCSTCRPLADSWVTPGLINTATVFEEYLGLGSRNLNDPAATAASLRVGAQLSRNFKHLAVCSQFPLEHQEPRLQAGALDALKAGPDCCTGSVSLAQLSAVLQLTAGIRESPSAPQQVRRWAPTGGNLGSVELYVAVRDVGGLSPGIYFYQSQTHSLAAINWRNGSPGMSAFMRDAIPGCPAILPDALVIATAALHRVGRKYGPFAFRLIHLDSGAAISQLHLAASGLGLCARDIPVWRDDRIEEEFRLDHKLEPITAVAALFESAEAAGTEMPPVSGRRPSTFLRPVQAFYQLPISDVLAMLMDESRITASETCAQDLVCAAAPIKESRGHSHGLVLPPPLCGGTPLGRAFAQRRTVRHYDEAPISLEELSTMLQLAQRSEVAEWPREDRSGLDLELVVLAMRVRGLHPGVYRYDKANRTLHFSSVIPDRRIELLVQDEFASAPVQIWITGNLAAACAHHGARGYRQLLVRAGAAAHRLWFAALGMNLDGAIVGGLVAGAARKLLGMDGFLQLGLVAFTAGSERAR